jgi:predicted nucleotidyltransferase
MLTTEERVKILKHAIFQTGPMNVNKTAQELKLSKALVSIYFGILLSEHVMRKSGKQFFVCDSVQTKALKLLVSLSAFDVAIFKKYEFVRSAGLYGSIVKGTNTRDSDIDLWIQVDVAEEEEVAGMLANLRKGYGNVKPIILTEGKVALLKERDPLFYHALAFGSIVIYGEGLEAMGI